MNAFFYKQIWHIVGDVVINVVLDFLNSGYMEPNINYTYIVLIPKIKSSKKTYDYRPISLCNVICKIISKELANRSPFDISYLECFCPNSTYYL